MAFVKAFRICSLVALEVEGQIILSLATWKWWLDDRNDRLKSKLYTDIWLHDVLCRLPSFILARWVKWWKKHGKNAKLDERCCSAIMHFPTPGLQSFKKDPYETWFLQIRALQGLTWPWSQVFLHLACLQSRGVHLILPQGWWNTQDENRWASGSAYSK